MTPPRHLLALDQGTSSSRAIVFDAAGVIVAVAQREFRQIFPEPGWVEHDPREIWSSQLATAREALAKSGLGATDIAAIGITNQRETTIVWNRLTGEPIGNAIVWQDRRTAPASSRSFASAPASSSTPTSPAPSSPGCSTTSTVRVAPPNEASSPSAPSTAG